MMTMMMMMMMMRKSLDFCVMYRCLWFVMAMMRMMMSSFDGLFLRFLHHFADDFLLRRSSLLLQH
jgi:hypothetical protein